MKRDLNPLWRKAKKDSAVPIYDYKCGRCKKQYEYFHVNSQDKKAVCPHCGSNDAKKLPSAPNHVINGASAKNNYGLKK